MTPKNQHFEVVGPNVFMNASLFRRYLFLLAAAMTSFGVSNLWLGIFHPTPGAELWPTGNSQFDALSIPQRTRNRSRVPLSSIVQGWNVTGDPSFLLDFAIIGFPKCGTSSIMYHLENHPEVDIFHDERCDMGYNQHVTLIRDLYTNMSRSTENSNMKRGLKCPMDLENTQLAMKNYQKYFPKTNYIVGIRHPVLWFESFYNFRIQNRIKMLPPEELIGRCARGSRNVCTFRSNFHLFLASLGKTNMGEEERALIDPAYYEKMKTILPSGQTVDQRILLYEVSQLSDKDPRRSRQFLETLQDYLGLRTPLDPMIWFRPGKTHINDRTMQEIKSLKINICDEKYAKLRAVLQRQAVNASRWIRDYFLDAPGVVVSSKEYLRDKILPEWETDPCAK